MGRKRLEINKGTTLKGGKKAFVAYFDTETAIYVQRFLSIINSETSGFIRRAILKEIERTLKDNDGIRAEFEKFKVDI